MLKRGVTFPIQLNKRDDLANDSGEDLDLTNLTFLFGIERNECPWDGELGLRLKRLKHMKQMELVGRAVVLREATDQVRKYAPGFVVTGAKVESSGASANVSIEVAPRANLEERLEVEREVS